MRDISLQDVRFQGAAQRPIHRLIGLVAAVAFCVPFTHPAQAQIPYTNTTFLNGFASDSLIWTIQYPDLPATTPPGSPGYLGLSVVLRTVDYPNVGASLNYTQQLASVAPFFVAGTQHVLVGHSLGSLIARGLYVNYPAIRPDITGIVTVAAPHQGAPIADNIDLARRFLVDVQRRVNDATTAAKIVTPVAVDLIGTVVFGAGTDRFGGVVAIFVDKKYITNSSINLDGLIALEMVPALHDLSPTSPTIDSLNHKLADAAIPHANIYGSISPRNAAIRVFSSMQNNDAGFQDVVSKRDLGVSLFKFCKYAGYVTIVLSKQARQCAYGVKVLGRVDDRWALYVNGTDGNGHPKQVGNDGIVPNDRSVYPAATNLQFNAVVTGANHMNIYKTRVGLTQVAQGMLRIGMVPVGAPPPPPGIRVTISGPGTVNLCGGSWFASPTGGAAPYTYIWTAGGGSYHTGSSNEFDYSPPRYGSIGIGVTATDAQGHAGTATKSVTVSSGGAC